MRKPKLKGVVLVEREPATGFLTEREQKVQWDVHDRIAEQICRVMPTGKWSLRVRLPLFGFREGMEYTNVTLQSRVFQHMQKLYLKNPLKPLNTPKKKKK